LKNLLLEVEGARVPVPHSWRRQQVDTIAYALRSSVFSCIANDIRAVFSDITGTALFPVDELTLLIHYHVYLSIPTRYTNVTDKQTDGRTDLTHYISVAR